jgi:hypothetical protein
MNDKITYDTGIGYKWVTAKYTGERAKKVKDHADANYGYYILSEEKRGKYLELEVAFKRVDENKPLDEHLEFIKNKRLIDKLERKQCIIAGLHRNSTNEICRNCGVN